MLKNTLIVMALESECPALASQALITGVGKVNAALALTKALASAPPPALIVNIGTAGGLRAAPGAVVNATRFIQRDMDARALGFATWQTPFEADGPLAGALRIAQFQEVTCGTGDSFETSGAEQPYEIVDMEAYALAKVAAAFAIPFACLKYISDGASENAATDWQAALEQCSGALLDALQHIEAHAPKRSALTTS